MVFVYCHTLLDCVKLSEALRGCRAFWFAKALLSGKIGYDMVPLRWKMNFEE